MIIAAPVGRRTTIINNTYIPKKVDAPGENFLKIIKCLDLSKQKFTAPPGHGFGNH